MVVVVVMVKWRAVVVLLCVSKRLFRMAAKVSHVLLPIEVSVMSACNHWVDVFTTKTVVVVINVMDCSRVMYDGLWIVVIEIVHMCNMVVIVDDVVHDMGNNWIVVDNHVVGFLFVAVSFGHWRVLLWLNMLGLCLSMLGLGLSMLSLGRLAVVGLWL